MNLILLQRGEVAADGRARVSDDRAVHIRNVLRAQPGDTLRVGLVGGPLGEATVETIGDQGVDLTCTLDSTIPTRPGIDLLLALPRPKVMKRLWSQLAALGVGRVILSNAARVERNYFDTHVLHPDVYTPLLLEGLQQARDTLLPHVTIHRRFRPLVEDELAQLSDANTRLVAQPGAPGGAPATAAGRILLAVGPEGGWVPFEIDLLQRNGFRPFGLGPRILRADTACIAAIAALRATTGA